MDTAQLRAWMLANFTEHPEPNGRTLFRLETLDSYEVAADGSDYRRYLDGAPSWTPERKEPWLDNLRRERARGLRRSRVHVLETPLSPYLRYEAEWGYRPNEDAGEGIGILNLSEVRLTAEERDLFVAAGDFWLLNDTEVVVMHYDAHCQFEGAELAHDPGVFVEAATVARRYAEPFGQWWARHPEEHRSNRQVA